MKVPSITVELQRREDRTLRAFIVDPFVNRASVTGTTFKIRRTRSVDSARQNINELLGDQASEIRVIEP